MVSVSYFFCEHSNAPFDTSVFLGILLNLHLLSFFRCVGQVFFQTNFGAIYLALYAAEANEYFFVFF